MRFEHRSAPESKTRFPAILDNRSRKGILRQAQLIIGPRFEKRKFREPDPVNEKTFGHFAILASGF
jgi:hypothetical protein